MSFPSIVTQSAGTSAVSTATSHTVTLPTGIVAGNLLIIIALNGSAIAASSLTTPAGWNSLVNNNTTSRNIAVIWKVADGTEGTTLGLTWSQGGRGTWTAYQFSGWDSASTPEVSSVATITSSLAPQSPALSPSWGAADTAFISCLGLTTGSASTVSAYPTNYTLGQQYIQNGGSSVQHSGSAVNDNTTATETPGAWSISVSSSGAALTLAIKPLAAVALVATIAAKARQSLSSYTGKTSLASMLKSTGASRSALRVAMPLTGRLNQSAAIRGDVRFPARLMARILAAASNRLSPYVGTTALQSQLISRGVQRGSGLFVGGLAAHIGAFGALRGASAPRAGLQARSIAAASQRASVAGSASLAGRTAGYARASGSLFNSLALLGRVFSAARNRGQTSGVLGLSSRGFGRFGSTFPIQGTTTLIGLMGSIGSSASMRGTLLVLAPIVGLLGSVAGAAQSRATLLVHTALGGATLSHAAMRVSATSRVALMATARNLATLAGSMNVAAKLQARLNAAAKNRDGMSANVLLLTRADGRVMNPNGLSVKASLSVSTLSQAASRSIGKFAAGLSGRTTARGAGPARASVNATLSTRQKSAAAARASVARTAFLSSSTRGRSTARGDLSFTGVVQLFSSGTAMSFARGLLQFFTPADRIASCVTTISAMSIDIGIKAQTIDIDAMNAIQIEFATQQVPS